MRDCPVAGLAKIPFASFFEAVPTPLLVISPPHWTIVAVNDARLQATGTTREQQVGRKLFDLFPDDPEDPAADGVRNLTASLERVLGTGAIDVMEVQRYAVREANGQFVERWWSPVNVPVFGDDGEVAFIMHQVEDVTEAARLRGIAEEQGRLGRNQQTVIDELRATTAALQESEARLQASEEFNRRVLASSADCIKVLDLDARLEFMTKGGMCVMEVDDFGAIHGARWPEFWGAGEQGLVLDAIDLAKQGGTGRFQGFAATMKGTPRWWDVIVTPITGRNGVPEKLLAISRDVTATKEAEARIVAINETLEAQVAERTADRDRMWRLSTDIMLVAQMDATIKSINPAWSELLGWAESDLVGSNFMDLVHLEDRQATIDEMGRLAAGATTLRFVNRYRANDDDYRWISWIAVPDDDLVHAVGRDVTSEKIAEEELALAQGALRQAQKMEAVGQLTGGLAHDFNNLLTGIMGNLELLQLRIARGRLDDIDRFVNAAQGAGRRAAALTHRLLAFSRRQTLDPKPTDINRLIIGMEELLRRTVGPGTEIEVVGAAGLWTTMIDPGQLENALLNLCLNARDAMSDGGKIIIETANKWLDGRTALQRELAPGQYLSLCVSDTGSGMTPETIERAFEPFFTTKPLGEGTGLGLSMIYGFARQSGGQVRIYSELGQGTTLCIYLPRFIGDATAEPVDPALPCNGAGSGETILVVDDEATIRHLIDEVLDDLDFRIIGAADGAAGLKVLQSESHIDLLITDVGLPNGMNGRQLADAARVLRTDLKILFITGFADNAAFGNAHLEPGMALLTKPFSMNDLVIKVREMLS